MQQYVSDQTETLRVSGLKFLGQIARFSNNPLRYAISAGLASFYVGLGIILIFTLGNSIPAEFRSLVMGSTFGIALSLVIILRVDLFTGSVMHATSSFLVLVSRQSSRPYWFAYTVLVLCVAYIGSLLIF